MSPKNALIILSIFTLLMPSAYAVEEYHHILTLQSPNPESSARYGYQVEISGNIIVLSERWADTDEFNDAGKVYVYNTDGTLISTLQSPTPGNGNWFGNSLALFEDTVIVGENSDIDDKERAGRVHVFSTNGTLQYSLHSEEPRSAGEFGFDSIAFDGEVMVISDIHAETDPGMAGKAHIYDSQGTYLKSLLSPSPKVRGRFGSTIEVGEGFILIGEFGGGTPLGPGSVYVFDYNGTHLMTLQAPEPENQAIFGRSIAINGNRIVIGESYATVDGLFWAGRAYIYDTDGEHLKTLESPKPKMNGRFGDSVAIDGDRLVVGEWDADVTPLLYEGRAYVFDVDGNLLQNLTAPDPCPRAAFGLDVDIDGDNIVIGEPWAATEDLGQAGRTHIFRLGPPLEAVFELSNLVIEPVSVNVGEPVTVSVDVENVGTKSGTYPVRLMIGGDLVEEKTATVDIGTSEKVSFTYQTDVEGSYRVEIGELEDSFKVVKPPIPGFPIIALAIGLLCATIFLTQRKR